MAKIMVFQHVPYEPLGTLDSLIRSHRHRIRYVNFGRKHDARPDIDGYDALIVLGGPQNVGEEKKYPHLDIEKQVILEAIKRNIPVLGICLGAQLIASAMGASVHKAEHKEVGWCELQATEAGRSDPLISAFQSTEKIFQWHSYTFELPKASELLVQGDQIKNQAFRFNENVYGFQFHLEASLPLIQRWLKLPSHQPEQGLDEHQQKMEQIWTETLYQMERSLTLSRQVFGAFLSLVPTVREQHTFYHRKF